MKQKRFNKAIALLLLGSMLSSMAVSTNAAWIGNSEKTEDFYKTWDSYLKGVLEEIEERKETVQDNVTTDDTAADTETETNTSTVVDSEMTVVEDATTVANGEMLRASTYALNSAEESNATLYADGETIKYFPVTLYNYDAETINNATHAVEYNDKLEYWNGIYFGYGEPYTGSYTYTPENATVSWESVTVSYGATYSNYVNNGYYYSQDEDTEVTALTCERSGYFWYEYAWSIMAGGVSYESTNSSITLYRKTASTVTTDSLVYAPHNVWTDKIFDASTTYASESVDYAFDKLGLFTSQTWLQVDHSEIGLATRAGYVYNGLVKNELDANKNIQFTVPDGGLFNTDATVKEIYTNVGLPFTYDADTLTYTFDSDVKSAQFNGTAQSNTNLVEDTAGGFFPFGGVSNGEIHHGMSATINFNMTPDGQLVVGTNEDGTEKKDPITFAFSGDDDVWVFIDGILVLDIGGIHDRTNGYLNFSDEAVTFTTSGDREVTLAANSSLIVPNSSSVGPGIINTTDGAVAYANGITGQLFNTYDADGNLEEGVLKQDIATFAAKADHELTIFYLERGGNNSNCMLEFNLPALDNVTVTKNIAGQAVVDENGDLTTEPLDMTAEQIAALKNLEFTFTLYKNGEKLANATYIRMNANGQTIAVPATDANGKFVLKNGETAKFIDEFSTAGDSYYVVEDIKNGFIYTDYKYSLIAAGSSTVSNATAGSHTYYNKPENSAYVYTDTAYSNGILTSNSVTVKGGIESEDSVAFVANNYVNASLPTPSAVPDDDKIVIDYGLPVKIKPAVNDLFVGSGYTISFPDYTATNNVYTAAYGTFTFDADTETITYTLNKQLTGVEVITYAMIANATTDSGSVMSEPVSAKIYIIPATTMYYEENFGNMVTYGKGWSLLTDGNDDGIYSNNTSQEPGVVGTVGDSPYGSDVAYLNDSRDSGGTSMYASTTSEAVQFTYDFTGTGTSFFARTTNNSGYMRVVVEKYTQQNDENGDPVLENKQYIYRDTVYITDDDSATLYNIPVFTSDALDYGTYKVTVVVAKESEKYNYNGEFWLDGIRVYQPIYVDDANYSTATSAYATDGEANMVNVALRQKLLKDEDFDENGVWDNQTTDNFVLFTDTNGAMTSADEYESIGPKEEVYLNDGQSISFSLTGETGWNVDTHMVYLGIKAPAGSGTVTIGNTSLNINNSVDCYYDISDYATITEDDDGIKTATFTVTAGSSSLISVTNLKVTGNTIFTVIENTDKSYDDSNAEE